MNIEWKFAQRQCHFSKRSPFRGPAYTRPRFRSSRRIAVASYHSQCRPSAAATTRCRLLSTTSRWLQQASPTAVARFSSRDNGTAVDCSPACVVTSVGRGKKMSEKDPFLFFFPPPFLSIYLLSFGDGFPPNSPLPGFRVKGADVTLRDDCMRRFLSNKSRCPRARAISERTEKGGRMEGLSSERFAEVAVKAFVALPHPPSKCNSGGVVFILVSFISPA